MLRDHGQAAKSMHSAIGWNARMDGIQAAVLSLKLSRLEAANAARRAHARVYHELLQDVPGIIRPIEAPHNLHVYHIYAVRVPNRDAVLQRMSARGVNCGIHYPIPIHLQKAYGFLGLKPGSFPVAERCAQELLSLPMYPELRPAQIELVVQALKESLHH
jgi:dTDP-4-amino-4,6-dideoxygalactose transaminase